MSDSDKLTLEKSYYFNIVEWVEWQSSLETWVRETENWKTL